jgi:hypothetical protein
MNGVLGSFNLSPGVTQSIYVCGTSTGAVLTLNICNTSSYTAYIKAAVTASSNVAANTEWFEFGADILSKGTYERSGVCVASGQYLTIQSSQSVSVVCWGAETGTDVAVSAISTNILAPSWTTSAALTFTSAAVSTSLVATDPNLETLKYEVVSGTLPPGVKLSTTGVLSGTIQSSGITYYTATVTASDTANSVPRTFDITAVLTGTISGGTETVVGSYKYHTFTTATTFTVTASGPIEVFAWGGGGAGGTVGGWGYGAPGGAGGAATGSLTVATGTTYSVVVGGGGIVNASTSQGAAGGGGAATNNNSDNRYAGGGGGLSGIFTSVSVTQANSLIIAGGGGGGGSSRAGTGNAGGGGGGGTQSAGGTGTGGNPGTALQGGTPGSSSYGGGGGGGYWGGAGGGYSESNTMAGGGGGSGYLHPTLVTSGTLTSAVGITPGNSANALRSTYGGAGAVAGAGTQGVVIVRYKIN